MKVFSRYCKDICYNVIQEVHKSYSSFPRIETHQVGDEGSITKESDSAETKGNCPHLIYCYPLVILLVLMKLVLKPKDNLPTC
jgi:hypothetical protein